LSIAKLIWNIESGFYLEMLKKQEIAKLCPDLYILPFSVYKGKVVTNISRQLLSPILPTVHLFYLYREWSGELRFVQNFKLRRITLQMVEKSKEKGETVSEEEKEVIEGLEDYSDHERDSENDDTGGQ
jgi:hypothetical protein